jgi:multimeric flavodoxin WrbA
MKLRLVGISSSPKKRSTYMLVEIALEAAKDAVLKEKSDIEIETEIVSFKGKRIRECIDCEACLKRAGCILKDDWYECVKYLIDPVPDGVIIGSPVYFFSVNSQLRAFFERCRSIKKKDWYEKFPFQIPNWTKTVAGAVTTGYHRNGGQEHAAANIINWFLLNGFVSVGSFSFEDGPRGYTAGTAVADNISINPPILSDEYGIQTVKTLGSRVGETALRLHLGDIILNKDK